MKKRILILTSIVLVILSLTSCSLFNTADRYVGGELLDDDMMLDIWQEFFSSEPDELDITESFANEEESESEENETTDKNASVGNNPNKSTVYWAKGGSVWHTHRDCGSLKKSKEIFSGSVEEAKEEGKTKLCSYCEKKDKS